MTSPADVAALAKPKQLALLMVALMGSYFAGGGGLDSRAGLLALAGLAGMGGATMINMYYDRDIDGVMARTRSRPLPSGRASPAAALLLGTALSAAGAAAAAAIGPPVAAAMLVGLYSYVVAYTQLSKRYTRLSIVTGGLAGAAPALGGWAAATGSYWPGGVALAAALLAWQPAHVWLLAYRHRLDYARAGVAALPTRDLAGFPRLLAAAVAVFAVVAWTVPILSGRGYAAAALATLLLARSARHIPRLASGDDRAALSLFKSVNAAAAVLFTLTPLEAAAVAEALG